ncbi:MAG: hypothetical protein JJU05_06845 [Verrucomicrobia bacterium]|nr:hypothetical protein [Verrucomicrobiota bacterium]MCH8527035.1 hypothetical protein [Kiritimatiellia bacterium]
MKPRIHPVLLCALLMFTANTGRSNTTVNSENAYAYGANIGWINFRADGTNGAVIGRFFSEGWLWSPNVGWISLGSGTPANGWFYANNSATDWGVNLDEEGNLLGYAYGANVGWINFQHGQDGYEPKIDLLTGALSGYVYGANIGWIRLDTAQAFVQTDLLASGPDGSVPGVPAAWEAMMGGTLDGMTDEQVLLYYTWGNDPTTPNGTRITFTEPVSSPVEGMLIRWQTSHTRQYLLEINSDLQDELGWEDSGFGVMQGVSGAMTRVVPHDGATIRFFRIRPQLPLSP